MNTEQHLEKLIDRNVYVRVNTLGEMLLDMWAEGPDPRIIEDVHMPDYVICGGDHEYFEPMQYFMISEYLAQQMLKHGLSRDALIELFDGTWIWVRCGCGYALSDDLAKYFQTNFGESNAHHKAQSAV